MFSFNSFTRKLYNGKTSPFSIRHSLSLPSFDIIPQKEKRSSKVVENHPKEKKVEIKEDMEEESTSGKTINSGQIKVHSSCKKSIRNRSRHEHKCSKEHRHRKSHLFNKNADGRFSSQEKPYFPGSEEIVSPLEMNISVAYQHLKNENNQLKIDIQNLREENDEIRLTGNGLMKENENLKEDVSLMKNLVYKLNVELERYQNGKAQIGNAIGAAEKLPKNYDKNFLRPVVPLLKAYSESIQEKDDTIKELEAEYKKFNVAFNEILQENEKLYVELEKKFMQNDGNVINEVKVLKKDLEMAKEENNLLFEQIKLEKEKLIKIHSVFKIKVEEASKEKEGFKSDLEEFKSDYLVMKGKYAVLKQEFDRLKMENDTRVPLAVHSASINECRKLFQDLKNEYENEKSRLIAKIKTLEENLQKLKTDEGKWKEKNNELEKNNFNQSFEIESLFKKVSELESQLVGRGSPNVRQGKSKEELIELRKQLSEANQKIENLNKDLLSTRKKLHRAMQFAEDIVRGQEKLLMQLHEKQKENNYMSAQFGSLKIQLKDVERGAQEGLNSIEQRMKSLESENQVLVTKNQKLEKILIEKENIIKKLEPVQDLTTS